MSTFADLIQRLQEHTEDNSRAHLIRRFADDDVLEAVLDDIFALLRRGQMESVSFWAHATEASHDVRVLVDTSNVYLHGWCSMTWDYDGIEWFDDNGHFSWWGIGLTKLSEAPSREVENVRQLEWD